MAAVKTYLEAVMTLDEAPLKLDPGQVVFSAGDAGREMFIVRTGSVDLRIGDTLLETVEQGGIFGELALVDPAPRSATCCRRQRPGRSCCCNSYWRPKR